MRSLHEPTNDLGDIASALTSLGKGFDAETQETLALLAQVIHESDTGEPSSFQIKDLSPYLKGYLFVKHHPWVLPAGIALFLTGIAGLGYWLGGRRR